MKQIPMLDLKLEYEYMKNDVDAAIKRCLDHQRWIFGPEITELEERIAEYIGVNNCIGVCSGTEALVLSLRAMAIKSKEHEFFESSDEIITTPFTFTATGDAILRSGATPVFVDIDPATYNIDLNKIRDYLTQNLPAGRQGSKLKTCLPAGKAPDSKVVGIIPVHIYGQACNMDEVMKMAKEYNLFVVEDVAQAFGGMWKDKKLGSIGSTGAFSFFPAKNLGGFGDGGMITTNDNRITEIVRMLLKHGGKDKYNVDHVGYNARLDTLQAAIVLSKLKYIDEFNEKRRKIAAQYDGGLTGVKGIQLPEAIPDAHHVSHQYTIRVLDGKRDQLQQSLKEKGVSTMIYYPFPLHKMKVFSNGRSKSFGSLENASLATESVLSLPVEPLMNSDSVTHVIECIKASLSEL